MTVRLIVMAKNNRTQQLVRLGGYFCVYFSFLILSISCDKAWICSVVKPVVSKKELGTVLSFPNK